MKKSLLLLSAAAAWATTSCASRPAPEPRLTAATEAPATPPTAPAAEKEKPELGTFGFDTAGMDRSVAPGEDWFAFANGTWARKTEIPADRARYGMFNVLDDRARLQNRAIIEEAAKDRKSVV